MSEVPDTDMPRWGGHDYIDIYFKEFHPVWPFLPGAFDYHKEPCILVQSIIVIGLWIKGGQREREMALDLYHKLRSAINAQMVRITRRL